MPALANQPGSTILLPGGDAAGYFAFDLRQLTAADTGALTGGVDVGQAAALFGVDGDGALFQAAAQVTGQAGVGHQAETAGQVVAGYFLDVPALADAHGFQALLAKGLDHMGIAPIGRGPGAGPGPACSASATTGW